MKIIFYKSLLILFFVTSVFIGYLSIFGIETTKFNSQISKQIKNLNKDLVIDLKKIKIVLDILEFKIRAKTIGSNLKFKDEIIEIENIQTQISINSFIKNEFLLNNLLISTNSIEVQNLISILRTFKKDTKFYFLEKLIKKGYLIADIEINFDNNGKIKNNYRIKGFVKDTKIGFLNRYNLNKLNFAFDIKDKEYKLYNITASINKIPTTSEEIVVKKIDNKFFVSGDFANKQIDLKKDEIKILLKSYLGGLDIKKIKLESKNKFSFKLGKKLDIDELKLSSEINLINLSIFNNLNLYEFFPNSKEEINLNDHSLKIDYVKKKLSINGKGKILLQENEDQINYSILKENKKYKFQTNLNIINNPIDLKLLNYKKKENTKVDLKIEGTYFSNKDIKFNLISFKEKKNNIKIEDLVINKDLRIKKFRKIILDYFDSDNFKNEINIVKVKSKYLLSGKSFNADKLIENLLNNKDDKKNFDILSKNFDLKLNIGNVYLDKDNSIKKLNGNLSIFKNQISEGNLNALFSENKKFNFTIKSDSTGKVTTLFLDKAEPIVKRYKFIKGYENGMLDFYSLKNNNKSISTLKIYDFKLKEVPALTKILTLASLQGIADILSGEGIRFDEFEMNFQNEENLMTINEIYAIGPAISIMMEGYVEKNKTISLRGTLVPATTINKAIGSIPVLGKILVGKKTGEGVFGVSFKIKGPPKKLETTVNPIKTLTPRFITRTLEKIKKN